MVSAALADSGTSCSAFILWLKNFRHGQPTESSMIGLNGNAQASPERSPVSMMSMSRCRVVSSGSRARWAGWSIWAMTNSGTNRGSG